MNRPRKSIAELLRERMAAKAEANPAPPSAPIKSGSLREAEPTKIVADSEASPAREPITPAPTAINLDAARMNAIESTSRPARLPPRPYAPIPANEFCGARTSAGTPCKSRALYRSGRCKNHGGMSTGPKTAEGKARVARNGSAPKKSSRREPFKT